MEKTADQTRLSSQIKEVASGHVCHLQQLCYETRRVIGGETSAWQDSIGGKHVESSQTISLLSGGAFGINGAAHRDLCVHFEGELSDSF